jgi:peptide deformylase
MQTPATLRNRRKDKEEADPQDEDQGFYTSDYTLPPPPAPLPAFQTGNTLNTWDYLKLIWTDKTARGDNIWDLIGLWFMSAHSWRQFFSEVDPEEGGRLLWKKKLHQWWSDNWWLVGLGIVAIGLTLLFGWFWFAPGTDAFGAKRNHLPIPYQTYDWSYDPEKAKSSSRLRCVEFTDDEIEKLRQNKGPWFQEYYDAMDDIMRTNGFAALASIHLGEKYSKCFGSVINKDDETVLMINPKIVTRSTKTSEMTEMSSFCPGVEKKVERATLIKVDFIDHNGNKMHETFKNAHAAMVLHVIDQLEGTCICNM